MPHGLQQIIIVERFWDYVRCTCFDRAHGHWEVAVACEEYDGHLNSRFGKLPLQVESTYPGEIEIRDQATGWFRSRDSQELLP